MTWDSKPEDCPKTFNIHSEVCSECGQRTECLQAAMGDKLDAYIRVSEESLRQAERWEKERKEQAAKAGVYTAVAGLPKKRDRKELLDEFLTDFCDFAEALNANLIAVGIKIEVPDLITMFSQWQQYRWQHKYDTEEHQP